MPLGLFGRLSFSDPKKSSSGWFGRNVQAPPREENWNYPASRSCRWIKSSGFERTKVDEGNVLPHFR